MLLQPLVWDMTPEQWEKAFEDSQDEYHGKPAGGDYRYLSDYWNRHIKDDESIVYTISCNATTIGNGVAVNELPAVLNNGEILDAIMLALIEVFDADDATIGCSVETEKAPLGFSFARLSWKTWVKRGDDPWPWLQDWQKTICGEPTAAEPWHGGTLFTWSHHAPWLPLPRV
jgi:hypothetical protein